MSARKRNNVSTKKNQKLLQRELLLLERDLKRSSQPPKWLACQPTHRLVRLGVVADQTETDVTVQNVMFFQCLATSTTIVWTLAYAIKLKAVRIWFTSKTVGTTLSATIEWNAAATGFLVSGRSVSESNVSTTEPVMLEARPPKSTLSSWYQGGPTVGANSLFSFSAPAGAILEIEYDWVMASTEANPVASIAVTSAVTGNVYCRGVNANVLALPPLNSVF